MKYYIGMDIGGTKCSVVLKEKDAPVFAAKTRFETRAGRGSAPVIEELISGAEKLITESGVRREDVLACGISCGGPLNPVTGVVMSPPNLPGWDNVPLTGIVSEALGMPCYIRNDADACALAEWKYGAGRGCSNMIFLTFGTGMGAGLILGGRLYSGTGGTAGEVGHIRLAETGPCGYGKNGSFEGFCSGSGIASLAETMLRDYGGETVLRGCEITAKSVSEAAKAGDALAAEIYRESGRMLGRALAVLIDVLAPERIIIGSIYQRSGELMRGAMYEELRREALAVNLEACEILPALLGDEIGDYAAAGVAETGEEK